MTREEIRNLIGGYATGTLTEAERKLLFEASLDDQDLFDELAGEQTLKEVLEEPGAKQRLIAALAPPPRPFWTRPWPWVSAAAAAAAGLLLTVVLLRPARVPLPSAPVQIAEV